MTRMRSTAVAMIALAASLTHARASAQAVQLDQYRPAETGEDGFAISRPTDLGHLRWSALLHIDYGFAPLVVESTLGDSSTESRLVEHQLVAHAGFALGLLDRLVLFAGLPVTLVMDGEDAPGIAAPDGAGLGDLRLGARGRLFGEPGDLFALAAQLAVTFPTAQAADGSMRFNGEDGATFQPELLAELRPGAGVAITLDLGARLRATDRARSNVLTVGHELTYGLGVNVPVVDDVFEVLAEVYGSASFESFGDRQTSPLEATLGGRVQPVPGLRIGLAMGPGISRGYGSPDFRGVLSVSYTEPPPAERVAEAPEPTAEDVDGDGILPPDDACPTEPEDRDGFQDEDGCPDPDNDGDGVLDGDDGCPTEAEDMDGFEDEDGCPDADNDGDGITDAADECPNEAEDMDRFEDANGCPDADNDQDTVLDVDDECPLEPGPPDANGCPRNVRLDTETGQIRILQRVEFATNQDRILSRSAPVLEDVRAVLAANPQLARVRVEGHTDDRGRDEHNRDLSARRARSVMRWLVEHGIDAARVEGVGCGELHPFEDNGSASGRQANRRVEFHVVDPVPPQGARHLDGCLEIDL
ncbi:MAG: OmpA family protein [Sandaracinaceae bacterium]|nr:OmpA family protein [Sandaracinaceae bacterium]